LYKTDLGLKAMDKYSKKYKKIVSFLGYAGIVAGYIGMIYISYLVIIEVFRILTSHPDAVGGGVLVPGTPIRGLGITFPLIMGWLVLFITASVHEFSHGIIARVHNIKIKSSGPAFIGPMLAAFVEPDENSLKKAKKKHQLSMFAAGPFSNIILFGLCLLLFIGSSNLSYNVNPEGVEISITQDQTLPAYTSGMSQKTTILEINNTIVNTRNELGILLYNSKPGETLLVKTIDGDYEITLTSHPDAPEIGYMGIQLEKESIIVRSLDNLKKFFFWMWFINLMVGLANLFPIYITDGAQMLRANFESLFKKDNKKAIRYWKIVNNIGLTMFAILLWPFFKSIIIGLINILTGQIPLF